MSGLMESWLDCEDYGAVDHLDTESVVTEFFTIGVPIWPSRTVYVSKNGDGEERRIQIPLDHRSVALGYLRVSTWLGMVFFLAPALSDFARFAHLLVPAILFGGVAAVLQFVVGKLDPAEIERRTLLRRTAGIGAPPELLPKALRHEIREDLADRWYTANRLGWREAIDDGLGDELLVALAEYHGEPVLVRQAQTNLAADIRWN